MSVRTRRTRSGIRTALAIVLLAIMLFPVYWMLNISLQSSGRHARHLVLPDPPEPGRLPNGDPRPGSQPGHEHDHRRRNCGADPADRHTRRVRPGAVPLPLDQLGTAGDPHLPDDPGDRDRQRALQHLRTDRPARLHPGPDHRQRDRRGAVRDLDHAIVHARNPAIARGGSAGRRGRAGPRLPVHRDADQPELADHRRSVRFHLRLERFRLRPNADDEGRTSSRSRSASTPTSEHTSPTGAR